MFPNHCETFPGDRWNEFGQPPHRRRRRPWCGGHRVSAYAVFTDSVQLLPIGGVMKRSHLVLAAATALTLIFLRASDRPVHAQQTPPILIESLAGRDSFQQDRAPCHGTSGRSHGPVASALRARPADLTALARQGGGAFPGDRVRNFVTGTGRALAAHGTTEMPIGDRCSGRSSPM